MRQRKEERKNERKEERKKGGRKKERKNLYSSHPHPSPFSDYLLITVSFNIVVTELELVSVNKP